jgi:FMN-dependent NADH-azoreductase
MGMHKVRVMCLLVWRFQREEYQKNTLVDLVGFKFPSTEKLTKPDIAQDKINKELTNSLFSIKKLIMQLPLNNELTIEEDNVVIDLIVQNLRTDYKIYIMGCINDDIKSSRECIETLGFCSLFRGVVDEYLAVKVTHKPYITLSNMLQELRAEVDNEVSVSKRSLSSAKIEERKSINTLKETANKVTELEKISSINSISSRNISTSKLFGDSFFKRAKVLEPNDKTIKRNVAEIKKSIPMCKTMEPIKAKKEYDKLMDIIKINQSSKYCISTKTIPQQMQTSKIDDAPKSQAIPKLELSMESMRRSRAKGNSYRSVDHNTSYSTLKQNKVLKNAGVQIAMQSISSIDLPLDKY